MKILEPLIQISKLNCFYPSNNDFESLPGAKEEAEDLDLEWEDLASANGGKNPGSTPGQIRGGKFSPKKKVLTHSSSAPNFDLESSNSNSNSNSTGFVNIRPGFSPFATPLKRDEMSYDWVSRIASANVRK